MKYYNPIFSEDSPSYETAPVSEHPAEASHDNSGDVFNEVFSNMGDHNGFYVGPYHICDLPYIFWDKGELFVYRSTESMLKDGVFTTEHHHIYRNDATHTSPDLDLSVTNLVAYQWIAMLFIIAVFKWISRKSVCKPTIAPKGFLANAAEKVILYIRDEVVLPNFSDRNTGMSLAYYFIATFIFILIVNFVGLIPGGHSPTGALAVTMSLALVAFFVINGAAIKYSGVGHWFHHLLGGAPPLLAPIMIPLELLGLFIKPFSLTIRLFANMNAGHIILFSLLGLLFYFNTYILAVAIVPFSVFIYLLELLVCFIQAFVFTMLVAIYTSTAIGDNKHKQHA